MYDFAALTLLHPPLLAHLSLTKFGKQYIQNTNQGAREWNIAIAKKEFGIELTIPDEAIVPTMGGREMYVDWIGGMNTEKAKDKRVKPEQPSRKRKREETIQHRLLVSTEEARILDIGCGATAIYALIAAKKWGNQAKFWITGSDFERCSLGGLLIRCRYSEGIDPVCKPKCETESSRGQDHRDTEAFR